MTPLKILEQAQQRDITAIISILNYLLKEKTIIAKAAFRGNTLVILLTSFPSPDQAFAVSTIQKLLKTVKIQDLETVEINAKEIDQTQMAWQEILEIEKPLHQGLTQVSGTISADSQQKRGFLKSRGVSFKLLLKGFLFTVLGGGIALGSYLFYCSQTPATLVTETTALPIASSALPVSPDAFQGAVNQAMEAAMLTQTASTPEDWQEVSQGWETAIALMQSVPPNHPRYAMAQQKAVEYQQNLTYAQDNANSPRKNSPPMSGQESSED